MYQLMILAVVISSIVTSHCSNTSQVTTFSPTNINTSQDYDFEQSCLFYPNRPRTNISRNFCCNRTMRYYFFNWAGSQNTDLTKFLEVLRGWNCPQFAEECRIKTFAHNYYTELVYDLYCDYEQLTAQCISTVVGALKNARRTPFQQGLNTTLNKMQSSEIESSGSNPDYEPLQSRNVQFWRNLTSQISNVRFIAEDILKPCVQIAIYDAQYRENDFVYHEVTQLDIPSCGVVWCGMEESYIEEYGLTAWACLPNSCRARVITTMAVCALLAIVVTLANLSVITVILYNPKLQTSPGLYRLSLGVADLLVGLIVFPTFISSLARRTMTLQRKPNFISSSMPELNLTGNVLTSESTAATYSYGSNFTQTYYKAIGLFTTLSLAVSVYILTAAAFDRLLAVHRPIKYGRLSAKKWTKRVCVTLWIVAIILSVLPLITPGLNYGIVVSFVVSLTGGSALILYAIALAVPLVAMWTTTIATYIVLRKNIKLRDELTSTANTKKEFHFAKTLVLMVAVFTLSVLPVAVVSIVALSLPTTVAQLPRRLVVRDVIAVNTSEFISAIILVLNSLWNFFIYSGRDKGFRIAVKNMYSNSFGNLRDMIGHCMSRVAYGGRKLSASATNKSGKSKNTVQNSKTTGLQPSKTGNANNIPTIVTTNTNTTIQKRKSGKLSRLRKTFSRTMKKKVSEAGDDSVFAYEPSKEDFVAAVMEDVDRKVFSKSSISSVLSPNVCDGTNNKDENLEVITEVGSSKENVFFPESMEIVETDTTPNII